MVREKLIKLIRRDNCPNPYHCSSDCEYVDSEDCHAERLADLILADNWTRLPCKVGDKIYYITPHFLYIKEYEVVGFHIGDFPTSNGHKRNSYLVCYEKLSRGLKHIPINVIDKIAFFHREDAERVLKGGESNV